MAKINLSIRGFAKHPATVATSAVAVLGGLLHLPLLASLWSGFYATAGSLFGALAVLSFVAEHVPQLQNEWIIVPMVIVGAVAFHSRIMGWWESFNNKVED